jgi:SAM-dependent methyltransferase
VQLIRLEWGREACCGVDLQEFDTRFRSMSETAPRYWPVRLRKQTPSAIALTEPAEAFVVDFWEAEKEVTGVGADGRGEGTATECKVIRAGAANATATWFTLHLDKEAEVSSSPEAGEGERNRWRQAVVYMGYEHDVAVGAALKLRCTRDSISYRFWPAARSRPAWAPEGVPQLPILPYHYRMLQDVARNVAYSDAIRAAVEARRGGRCRVLDIGSGSGLLAVLAARGGASAVVACEMVPALAGAARSVVRANGVADVVTVVNAMSTELRCGGGGDNDDDDRDVGAKFDVIVGEVLDSQLLGEGVLPSYRHAIRSLLAPGGEVIPRRATMQCMAVELLPYRAEGFNLKPYDWLRQGYSALRLDTVRHRKLSVAADVMDINLAAPPPPPVDGARFNPTPVATAKVSRCCRRCCRRAVAAAVDNSAPPATH